MKSILKLGKRRKKDDDDELLLPPGGNRHDGDMMDGGPGEKTAFSLVRMYFPPLAVHQTPSCSLLPF